MTKKFILGMLLLLTVKLTFSQSELDLINQANEYTKNKKYKDAIKTYNKIIKANSNYANIYDMKGICYVNIAQTDSACVCFINGIEKGSQQSHENYQKYCNKYNPKLQTNKFKLGNFKYIVNDSITTIYFNREQKNQIEYIENSMSECYYEITWNSNIEYELKFVENNDTRLSVLKKDDVMKFKILKVMGDKYVYSSDFNGTISYGTIEKIKN